jgi:hypothetical protein
MYPIPIIKEAKMKQFMNRFKPIGITILVWLMVFTSIGTGVYLDKPLLNNILASNNPTKDIVNNTQPNINVTYSLELSDKNGKVSYQSPQYKSHSYVIAMADWLFSMIGNTTLVGGDLNIGSTVATMTAGDTMSITSVIGAVTRGIIIGTGQTAPAVTDYKIQTIIPNSATQVTGDMYYQATTIAVPQTSSGTRSFTITRVINNNSGASITVYELAVYGIDTTNSYCLIHDAISGGFAVPNGKNLTVVYTISVTT